MNNCWRAVRRIGYWADIVVKVILAWRHECNDEAAFCAIHAMDCTRGDAACPGDQIGRGPGGCGHWDAVLVRTHPKRF